MSAFRVKLGASDLNCVDVPLNPAHSLTTAAAAAAAVAAAFLLLPSSHCMPSRLLTTDEVTRLEDDCRENR